MSPEEFTLNANEAKEWHAFKKMKCAKTGEKYCSSHTISFTPTSIGCAIEVTCACGYNKKNITDYDSW